MSNRSKQIDRVFSCIVAYDDITILMAVLESMRDDVWISKTCACTRHALRGVPSRRVDVLIDRRLEANEPLHPKDTIELSVVRKLGRYDAQRRDRLAVRMIPAHACESHERYRINIAELAHSWRVDVATELGVVRWTRQYDRLRSDLDEYDPARIVMWHWTRYYRHLDHAVAEQTAQQWAMTDWAQQASGWTLAEANRSASRTLYRASREEGWRKLTLREKTKLGVSGDGQWHRVDSLPIHAAHQSGAGQATIEAANGLDVKFNMRPDDEELWQIQEQLEAV